MNAAVCLLLYIPVEILFWESYPFDVVFLRQFSVHLADELRVCGNDGEVLHAYSGDECSVCTVFREYAWVGFGLLIVMFLRWSISPSK